MIKVLLKTNGKLVRDAASKTIITRVERVRLVEAQLENLGYSPMQAFDWQRVSYAGPIIVNLSFSCILNNNERLEDVSLFMDQSDHVWKMLVNFPVKTMEFVDSEELQRFLEENPKVKLNARQIHEDAAYLIMTY